MAPARNSTYGCTPIITKEQTTTESNLTTTAGNGEIVKSEIHAVLYIVVTLLFYSLGIIVGIILYLKREKREIEEDKLFDEYVTFFEDPQAAFRYARVQQVVARLNYLEEQKFLREQNKNQNLVIPNKGCSNSKRQNMAEEKKITFVTESMQCENNVNPQNKDSIDSKNAMECSDIFQENGQSLSAVVAKLINPEKDTFLLQDQVEDSDKSKVPQTRSMQSIKDYDEEPRRSERSSVCSNEENIPAHENLENYNENYDVFDVKEPNTEETIKGCIVTSV